MFSSISTRTRPESRPDDETRRARRLALAIAGLGMAGAVMVQAAAAHPGCVLVAAADPHPAPRAAFARDFNARAYADIAELCADPAVEVIYIATPHQFHARTLCSPPTHGKHVILEKPMALTLADCDAIIAAVERAQRSSDRRPHPRLRSGSARDAAHHGER